MKITVGVMITLILLVSVFVPTGIVFAESTNDNIVVVLSETHTDNQIDITVNLLSNPGVSDMLWELVYDKDVFKFNGYDQGEALSDLDLMVTDLSKNPNLPVKFNWYNQKAENDYSTGTILIIHFNLLQNIPNGEYKITFKCKDEDIVHVDGTNTNSVPALFSKAVISVAQNKITKTEIIEESEDSQNKETDNSKLNLILGIVIPVAIIIIAFASVIILKVIQRKRKSKNWVKM